MRDDLTWISTPVTTYQPSMALTDASEANSSWDLDDGEPEGAEPCSDTLFFFIVYGPIYGAVCGFGIIGNTLSFAVLHRNSKINVATYLLKVLAVMDNAFLAVAAFVQIYPAMVVYFGQSHLILPVFYYFRTIAWPLTHTVQLGTVWVMVLVAANRYIAVCKPLHAARLCSMRNVRCQTVVLLICVVLFNIPRIVEYRYVNVNVTSAGNGSSFELAEVNVGLASYPIYNILYENVAYCLFAYLIPLGLLIVFNAHLVLELKRAQRCRLTLIGKASAEENNITLVMIIIILSFIICETPASINQILYYLVSHVQRSTCSSYSQYSHISNLLITTNSSLNFAIYCLFRRQFQEELRSLVLCRNRRGVDSHTAAQRASVVMMSMSMRQTTQTSLRSNNIRVSASFQPQTTLNEHPTHNPTTGTRRLSLIVYAN